MRILRKYPQIASVLAHRFPVIIVDEAQDTSREQMEILDVLSTAGTQTVILVGDSDQAIYEWRDATPEYFVKKMNDVTWTTQQLTANFRSSQHICNATALFSSKLYQSKAATAMGRDADNIHKPVLIQFAEGRTKEDIRAKFKSLCTECCIQYDCDNVAILTRARIHNDTDIPDLWQTPETKWLALATYQRHKGLNKEAYLLCEKALYSIFIADCSGILGS